MPPRERRRSRKIIEAESATTTADGDDKAAAMAAADSSSKKHAAGEASSSANPKPPGGKSKATGALSVIQEQVQKKLKVALALRKTVLRGWTEELEPKERLIALGKTRGLFAAMDEPSFKYTDATLPKLCDILSAALTLGLNGGEDVELWEESLRVLAELRIACAPSRARGSSPAPSTPSKAKQPAALKFIDREAGGDDDEDNEELEEDEEQEGSPVLDGTIVPDGHLSEGEGSGSDKEGSSSNGGPEDGEEGSSPEEKPRPGSSRRKKPRRGSTRRRVVILDEAEDELDEGSGATPAGGSGSSSSRRALTDNGIGGGRAGSKAAAKWQKAACEAREVALNDAATDREKLTLPFGFGLNGVKWSGRDLVKRINRLQELVHPTNHPDEPEIWKAAWSALQTAFKRLADSADEETEKENEKDPVQAALEWELADAALPKENYRLSVTWRPMRKTGGGGIGKKGSLPDRIRVHVVKALINKMKLNWERLQAADLLSPLPSIAMYGERGEEQKEYHLQGFLLWRSNGGVAMAVQAASAFISTCMLLHPEVNNTRELLVKPVGIHSEEHDPRSNEEIAGYPIKESHLPHSYGFNNYGAAYFAKALAAHKDSKATAGSTGYRKAGHSFRDDGKYENRIERKNMITLARSHTIRSKALFIGASFFRELCWLFQKGNHILDPGMIVYGSTAQDEIKLEALIKLNTNVQYAVTTTLMRIVVDHDQERMRSHEKLWAAVSNRPAWMVPVEVSEGIDLYEMEIFVETGNLPFRYERARTSLRLETKPRLGMSCVMDLAPSLLRPGSLRISQVLKEARYSVTQLMYEPANATDERGDLALAYLGHLLKTLPNPDAPVGSDTSLFGLTSFNNVLSVVDLMVNFSAEYHFVVHEHMLRGVAPDAPHALVQERIAEALRIPEYAELHEGAYHGVMGLERLEALIRETTSRRKKPEGYRTGLQCAIGYCEWSEPPPAVPAVGAQATGAAPPIVAPPERRLHHFAVVWEADDHTQTHALHTD